MKNIILIGMMGCGKTTCGGLLSRRLDRELVDTDALIAAREGRSIPEIFAAQGEDRFRELERGVAEELARREGLVVACGGGLPLRDAAMAPLKSSGTVVFLCRDPGETFDTVPMDAAEWLCVLALAVAPVAVCELEKRVRRKQPGRDDRRGIPNGVKGHT